jgi:hypothetical protein
MPNPIPLQEDLRVYFGDLLEIFEVAKRQLGANKDCIVEG